MVSLIAIALLIAIPAIDEVSRRMLTVSPATESLRTRVALAMMMPFGIVVVVREFLSRRALIRAGHDLATTRQQLLLREKLAAAKVVGASPDADLAVIDGLRPNYHPTHLSIDEACAAAMALRAKRALITHMTYQIDYETYTARLRRTFPTVRLCYDGKRIRLGERKPQKRL